jgi:GNAT superfamily N-acetyltransferase
MADDPGFRAYAEGAIPELNVVAAIDREQALLVGAISVSRMKNEITWFAVKQRYQRRSVRSRLLEAALRQVDHGRLR